MSKSALEAIRTQVMWNRLIAVVEEQAQSLLRTAFGTITREAGDLSAGVYDTRARMIAQAMTGTPGELVDFFNSAPLVALVLEAPDAVNLSRKTIGATKPADAAPGTIRGDLTVHLQQNLVHGSDSPESAARELKLWFPELS